MIEEKIVRCGWCEKDDLYRDYHDNEWGKLVRDDKTMFEFMILESFQAGLSWHTILKKRENFRVAFDDFDYLKIAHYSDEKLEQLMQDPGIIRNRLKILAARNNAQKFIELQDKNGSFADYLLNFADGSRIINQPKTLQDIPATSSLSDALAKELKKFGFKFLGSTVVYAYLQATGIINDHLESCSFK